jgi:hypothetical protein
LIVWDRLFGTYTAPIRVSDIRYGLTDKRHIGLAAGLLSPFTYSETIQSSVTAMPVGISSPSKVA